EFAKPAPEVLLPFSQRIPNVFLTFVLKKTERMTWYHTFFEGVPQRAWKLGQTEERDELEAEFLWDMLQLDEGSKVLDIFSGYGRHAIPLARNKVEMWC